MLKVLGSFMLPVMEALSPKVAGVAEIVPHDVGRALAEQVGDKHAVLVGNHKITADVLARAPHLRLLQQYGRGLDTVDRAAAAARGIVVANVPGGNSVAVAEHSLALILTMAKQLHRTGRSIAERVVGAPPGIELAGKTLLVVGLGAAGAALAVRAKALGMRVTATKGNPARKPDIVLDDLGGPGDLHRLLPEADVVVLLAALTPATQNLIGGAELKLMKPTAYLLNVARGGLVDRDALHDALLASRIAGSAFDTFWSEPADPSDPLLQLGNFVLTPHVAGFSDVAIDTVTDVVAENLRRLADGRSDLSNVVHYDGAAPAA